MKNFNNSSVIVIKLKFCIPCSCHVTNVYFFNLEYPSDTVLSKHPSPYKKKPEDQDESGPKACMFEVS